MPPPMTQLVRIRPRDGSPAGLQAATPTADGTATVTLTITNPFAKDAPSPPTQ